MKKFLGITILASTLMAAGCSNLFNGPDITRTAYMLNVPSSPNTVVKSTNTNLLVNSASISPAFAGRYFVYRKSQLIYDSDFYHYFFTSPSSQMTEIITRWMRDSGLFKDVITPLSTQQAGYVLLSHVNDLYADYTQTHQASALIKISFKLLKNTPSGTQLVFEKTYQAATPIKHGGADLVNGWSEDLTKILGELTTDVRMHITANVSSP